MICLIVIVIQMCNMMNYLINIKNSKENKNIL